MSQLSGATRPTLPRIWWERFWTPDQTVMSWWCAECEHKSRDYNVDEEVVARTDATEHDASHDSEDE